MSKFVEFIWLQKKTHVPHNNIDFSMPNVKLAKFVPQETRNVVLSEAEKLIPYYTAGLPSG